METVAFYSYKGGVGRTLLVANTAQFLALSGRRVVALDLDLEAPGLHQKLGNPDVLNRAASGTLRGVVDELLDALDNDPRDRSLRETAIQMDLPEAAGGALHYIPAGSAPSHAYWATLETLNIALRGARRNGGLPEAVLELQARIAAEFNPEFLLIDSRTGITELGGLATSLLADRVVCLTTTAPESVEGTLIVADALRTAPRLSSQRPLRIDFLITRVPAEEACPPSVIRAIKKFGESVTVLPHDPGIAHKEQVYAGWLPVDSGDIKTGLFSATLGWIAESFPGHKEHAEKARRRMEAIHQAWQQLTLSTLRVAAWPVDQLRERVKFNKGEKSRHADIAVYDSPSEGPNAKLLMIIEYVEGEDRDTVAEWWVSQFHIPVVVVLPGIPDRRIYSGRRPFVPQRRPSDRWDLPLPHDFEALSDPTDVSIDCLLDAIRQGHPEYLTRIIPEWVRCSSAAIRSGSPWAPQLGKKIIDGLSRIDNVELALRVLRDTSAGNPFDLGAQLGAEDRWIDELVLSELFSPLLWRLPPEASVELMRGRPLGPPSGRVAIALLARDILGLHYDPDATFRREGQRILDRTRSEDLYALSPVFKHTEISFEISSDLPPLVSGAKIGISDLVSERVAERSLVSTGLFGDYQPQFGKVILFRDAIAQCADKLGLQPRHVGSVTLIHETLHALAHLGRDLDGRMWPEFGLPAADSPLFEPSWFHEALTQYFTYKHIIRLQDSDLLNAFEVLSSKQASPYRVWRPLRDLPIEDARSWFMSVRRGVGLASPALQLLFSAMRDESA